VPWPRLRTSAAPHCYALRRCSRCAVAWRGVIAMRLPCVPAVTACVRHLDRLAVHGVEPGPWPLSSCLRGSSPALHLNYHEPPAASGSTDPSHRVTATPLCLYSPSRHLHPLSHRANALSQCCHLLLSSCCALVCETVPHKVATPLP
jgi:hypothetical protein